MKQTRAGLKLKLCFLKRHELTISKLFLFQASVREMFNIDGAMFTKIMILKSISMHLNRICFCKENLYKVSYESIKSFFKFLDNKIIHFHWVGFHSYCLSQNPTTAINARGLTRR